MVFMNKNIEKVDFEKNQQGTKSHEKLPSRQSLTCMKIYLVRLEDWILDWVIIYVSFSCVQAVKALARLQACAVGL